MVVAVVVRVVEVLEVDEEEASKVIHFLRSLSSS